MSDSSTTVAPPNVDKQPGRRLLIGLAISLALNVFLGGVVLGRTLSGDRGPRRHDNSSPAPSMDGRGFSIRSAERTLGNEVRTIAQPIEERRLESLRPQFDEMHAAHQRVFEALAAEPFDQEALEAALGDLRTRQGAVQEELNAGFVELVAKLTPQQRKELAEAAPRLRQRGKRGRRRRGD